MAMAAMMTGRHRRTRPSTWRPGTIQVTCTPSSSLSMYPLYPIWERCELAEDGGSFSMTVVA